MLQYNNSYNCSLYGQRNKCVPLGSSGDRKFTSIASHSRIHVSNDDVASWVVFGLKRTSVIMWLCSSGVHSVCIVSMFQRTTYWHENIYIHIVTYPTTCNNFFFYKSRIDLDQLTKYYACILKRLQVNRSSLSTLDLFKLIKKMIMTWIL